MHQAVHTFLVCLGTRRDPRKEGAPEPGRSPGPAIPRRARSASGISATVLPSEFHDRFLLKVRFPQCSACSSLPLATTLKLSFVFQIPESGLTSNGLIAGILPAFPFRNVHALHALPCKSKTLADTPATAEEGARHVAHQGLLKTRLFLTYSRRCYRFLSTEEK